MAAAFSRSARPLHHLLNMPTGIPGVASKTLGAGAPALRRTLARCVFLALARSCSASPRLGLLALTPGCGTAVRPSWSAAVVAHRLRSLHALSNRQSWRRSGRGFVSAWWGGVVLAPLLPGPADFIPFGNLRPASAWIGTAGEGRVAAVIHPSHRAEPAGLHGPPYLAVRRRVCAATAVRTPAGLCYRRAVALAASRRRSPPWPAWARTPAVAGRAGRAARVARRFLPAIDPERGGGPPPAAGLPRLPCPPLTGRASGSASGGTADLARTCLARTSMFPRFGYLRASGRLPSPLFRRTSPAPSPLPGLPRFRRGRLVSISVRLRSRCRPGAGRASYRW